VRQKNPTKKDEKDGRLGLKNQNVRGPAENCAGFNSLTIKKKKRKKHNVIEAPVKWAGYKKFYLKFGNKVEKLPQRRSTTKRKETAGKVFDNTQPDVGRRGMGISWKYGGGDKGEKVGHFLRALCGHGAVKGERKSVNQRGKDWNSVQGTAKTKNKQTSTTREASRGRRVTPTNNPKRGCPGKGGWKLHASTRKDRNKRHRRTLVKKKGRKKQRKKNGHQKK